MNFKPNRTAALLALFANFLQNLSVASAAVGMFQGDNFALAIAFLCIVVAAVIVYVGVEDK